MRNLALRDSTSEEIQYMAQACPDPFTLDAWLRENWIIIPDPPEAEYILSPALMVRCHFFAGDCDDSATLAASILSAMGFHSQLVAIRVSGEEDFSHVFVRVPWLLDIDPIVPAHLMPVSFLEEMVLVI